MHTNTLPYTVRLSTRAKRLQIKVGHAGDVEVVVPRRMRQVNVKRLLQEHRDWIEKARNRCFLERQHKPHLVDPIPHVINLSALDETWQIVSYQHSETRVVVSKSQDRKLLVQFTDQYSAQSALQQWLQGRAKKALVPWFHAMSEQLGFSVNRVFIKGQKSRWGSCSAKKNVNLNRNLLFLPADYVEYLFLHELCHTKHLNHSQRYWQLVESFEPEYREYESLLNGAHAHVPLWALV